MKNLMYGGMPILVTDDVADAVLHYAAMLAQIKASDVIAVPTVDRTGYASETSVLLAAGIPLAAEVAPDDELEDNNPSFVEELTVRIREVHANVSLSGPASVPPRGRTTRISPGLPLRCHREMRQPVRSLDLHALRRS